MAGIDALITMIKKTGFEVTSEELKLAQHVISDEDLENMADGGLGWIADLNFALLVSERSC